MTSNPIIKDEYIIGFKKFSFFRNEFAIKSIVFENIKKSQTDRLEKYKISASELLSEHIVYLKNSKFIETFYLCFYQLKNNNGETENIIEILDISVFNKYRRCGIGSQLMLLLADIALDNDVGCIVGELQEDTVGEPLNERKSFFKRHGFEIWKDQKAGFSGWVIKKEIS